MGLFQDLGVTHLAMHTMLAGLSEKKTNGTANWIQTALDFIKEEAHALEEFGYSRVLRLNTNFSHMTESDYLRFVLVNA